MAHPLINRFRYIILAVLIVATAAYGYYLWRIYVPAAPAEKYSVAVAVLETGSVRIDGTVYAAPDALKSKISEIERAHPGAGFSIIAPPGKNLEPVAKAVVLLQNSGAKTIWVINDAEKKGP